MVVGAAYPHVLVAAPAGFIWMPRFVPAALVRGVGGGGVDRSAAVLVDSAVEANGGEKRKAQRFRESPGDGGAKGAKKKE